MVAPERLRFDFTHGHSISVDDRRRIEDRVSEWILRAVDTRIVETGYQEAVASGAMALFGRSTAIACARSRSRDSVSSCAAAATSATPERSGRSWCCPRRAWLPEARCIEALTGHGARAWVRERENLLEAAEKEIGVPAERLAHEIAGLKERSKAAEKQLSGLRLKLQSGWVGRRRRSDRRRGEVLVREVPDAPAGDPRTLAYALRSKLGSGVAVLEAAAKAR